MAPQEALLDIIRDMGYDVIVRGSSAIRPAAVSAGKTAGLSGMIRKLLTEEGSVAVIENAYFSVRRICDLGQGFRLELPKKQGRCKLIIGKGEILSCRYLRAIRRSTNMISMRW